MTKRTFVAITGDCFSGDGYFFWSFNCHRILSFGSSSARFAVRRRELLIYILSRRWATRSLVTHIGFNRPQSLQGHG